MKRHAPLALRNRDLLLAVLRRVLPPRGALLELGSGTGEHAVFLARALPGIEVRPSDPDPVARRSIEAWSAEARLPNLLPPLAWDLRAAGWRAQRADAVLCVNVLHAAPAACGPALVVGSAEVLAPGGALVVYGPFRRRAEPLVGRLARFDATLRAADPDLGVREVEALVEEARVAGLSLAENGPGVEEGDRILVFRRAP